MKKLLLLILLSMPGFSVASQQKTNELAKESELPDFRVLDCAGENEKQEIIASYNSMASAADKKAKSIQYSKTKNKDRWNMTCDVSFVMNDNTVAKGDFYLSVTPAGLVHFVMVPSLNDFDCKPKTAKVEG